MPPDRRAITEALVAALAGDAALMALLPDGVWVAEAPPHKRRFATVTLFHGDDRATFGGRAIDDALYVVKAVVFDKSPNAAADAAARIDAVLENAALVVAGFTCMAVYREQPVDYPEVDDLDPSLRWQHQGGQYRVQFSVNGA